MGEPPVEREVIDRATGQTEQLADAPPQLPPNPQVQQVFDPQVQAREAFQLADEIRDSIRRLMMGPVTTRENDTPPETVTNLNARVGEAMEEGPRRSNDDGDAITPVDPSPNTDHTSRTLDKESAEAHNVTDDIASAIEDPSPPRGNLQRVRGVTLIDEQGNRRLFGGILDELRAMQTKKILVVFIRHFFCGHCQEYVRALVQEYPIPEESLPLLSKLIIVGCGAPSLIPPFITATNCGFPIYTEPSRRIYKLLGMKKSLNIGRQPPAYLNRSFMSLTIDGVKQSLRRIRSGDAHKSGNIAQNGGEFLFQFERNESGTGPYEIRVTWCHIMKNSREHAPIQVINRVLGYHDA